MAKQLKKKVSKKTTTKTKKKTTKKVEKKVLKKKETGEELADQFYDVEIDGICLRRESFKDTEEHFEGFDEDDILDEDGELLEDELSLEDRKSDMTNDDLRSKCEELLEDEDCTHPLILKIRKLSKKEMDNFWQTLHDGVWNGYN